MSKKNLEEEKWDKGKQAKLLYIEMFGTTTTYCICANTIPNFYLFFEIFFLKFFVCRKHNERKYLQNLAFSMMKFDKNNNYSLTLEQTCYIAM